MESKLGSRLNNIFIFRRVKVNIPLNLYLCLEKNELEIQKSFATQLSKLFILLLVVSKVVFIDMASTWHADLRRWSPDYYFYDVQHWSHL
jgi:hypothetical protein